MVAEDRTLVIGVDTHRDTHTYALVRSGSGEILAQTEFPADSRGYARALALARKKAPTKRLWAIEGTGSYGKGLARFLADKGEKVLEVECRLRPKRSPARGKSDSLDALRAARQVLEGQVAGHEPRTGAPREALRVLLATRESAVRARSAAFCQLRALIVSAPDELRRELRELSEAKLIARASSFRPQARTDTESRIQALAMRGLAERIALLTKETRELEREITSLVRSICPALLAEPGVGLVSAARLLVSWSHAGRLRDEAAFARLAGAAPLPASSGQVTRHRLDKGGDRQLNRALHTVVMSRRKIHPETIAYCERRISEGKSKREAMRCLKRYLARHFFRLMEAQALT